MNSKIQQLAQSYLESERFDKYGESTQEDRYVFYPSELPEFVESIVRECVNRGSVLATHYIEKHTEQEQTFLLAAVADYSTEIKKHFGVEE